MLTAMPQNQRDRRRARNKLARIQCAEKRICKIVFALSLCRRADRSTIFARTFEKSRA